MLARDDQPVTAHQIASHTHPTHLPEIVARLVTQQHTAAEQRRAAYGEWRTATEELAATLADGRARAAERSHGREHDSGLEL